MLKLHSFLPQQVLDVYYVWDNPGKININRSQKNKSSPYFKESVYMVEKTRFVKRSEKDSITYLVAGPPNTNRPRHSVF